jgi:hypothetical protein
MPKLQKLGSKCIEFVQGLEFFVEMLEMFENPLLKA